MLGDYWTIKPVTDLDIPAVTGLIKKSHSTHVAHHNAPLGNLFFGAFIQPDRMYKRLEGGAKAWLAEHDETGEVLGYLEMNQDRHINLFFVHPDHLQKGIGRSLMREVGAGPLTVRASTYGEPAYRALGFFTVGIPEERQGIKFLSMRHDKGF